MHNKEVQFDMAHQIALYLHILGAFGLVAAITVEAISLRGLRASTRSDDARMWLAISRGVVMRLAPGSLGLILLSGLYMMATSWGARGWILAALASLVLLAIVGGVGTGMRMARIGPAIGRVPGPLSDDLRSRLRDPILLTSLLVRSAIVLAIALLMTVKPSGLASLVIIVLAVGIGLLAGQLARRRRYEYATAVG
ncbi:MAG: hypothetical protein QOH92_533 [Chloroflexota bacterium]|jgi:hypothetical protein|nr:hypothetical protein [Chloroflexota bacterium]